MGVNCTIAGEKGGHCTAFDGLLPNGKNGWDEIREKVKQIECDTCRDDGLSGLSAWQDITNLSIGEITEPYDYNNLAKFVKKVNLVFNSLGHDVK